MTTKRNIIGILLALAMGAAAASPSFAAPRAGSHTKGGGDTGSFSLVLLNSTDGVPHYGQEIGFKVTTNAYFPVVTVDCYQGGLRVSQQSVGYYSWYMWAQVFGLDGGLWTPGAADCTAVLVSWNSKMTRSTTLATMNFHVYA
jgi:hypothetical protein